MFLIITVYQQMHDLYSFVSASVSMQDSQMVEPNVLEPPILDMVQDSDSDNSDVIPIGGYGCMLKIRPADSTTGDKLEGKRKLKVMTVNNKEERNSKVDYSKKHACLYCGKLDLKISRHLCKKHGNEKAIAQLAPPNQSKKAQLEREHVLDSLRNEGDFLYNIDLLQNRNKDGEGLIVAKRPVAGEHEFNDYLPCKYCLKFYLKSELWRHAKKCKFMPAPLLELTNNYPADLEEKESRKFIKDGINILKGAGVNLKHVTTSNDKEEFYYHVLGSIQNDDIGHKLKNDEGIIMFGKSEFERLGRRRANEVRYRMRLLQRIKDIVLSLDKSVTTSNLMSLLAPDRFEFFVEAVKVLVGIRKEKSLNGVVMFGKPQLAKKTGQIIRKFAEMCEGQSVVKRDREKRQEISDFMFMYTKNWSGKIGSLAHQTSVEDKFNKKEMLPLTKDLSKLQNYLDNEMPTQCQLVEKCPTKENWRILSYILLTKLTLFNFRRGNEVAAMQITKFNERGDWRGSNEEIYQSLSNFEQALAKRMDLVEVMGKQNKKVPVLLTPATKAGLIQLNKFRHATEVYPENPYVFAKGKDKFIQGHEALKYVLEQVPELEQPESLKFPTMRKYLATVVQVFGMKETDVAEVARHMGHELSVHRKFYRLQDDIIELAKISKLLLAVERGKAHKYSGISLDDLDLEDVCIIVSNAKLATSIDLIRGEERVYKSQDEGDVKNIKEKEKLYLKVGCPIILIVNLSDELVNGLEGKVCELYLESVVCFFPSIKRKVENGMHYFKKYSVEMKKDIGCRKQLPLSLAFAFTVHKSQGMTIDRISIDCSNMFQYGQLAVAVSRARNKRDMEELNSDEEPELIEMIDKIDKSWAETDIEHEISENFNFEHLLLSLYHKEAVTDQQINENQVLAFLQEN
ncbi:hypothetical protein KUTeg_002631 [Tegillarca granosa]|uniref:DNA helicase n=1 Tax=Tegillarca granosa TaxID=220873 RepID=A0ABQ9FUZ2_TEGGR|nr:hypothetical protein KUTeg_002631 [Tegillarca granosa]